MVLVTCRDELSKLAETPDRPHYGHQLLGQTLGELVGRPVGAIGGASLGALTGAGAGALRGVLSKTKGKARKQLIGQLARTWGARGATAAGIGGFLGGHIVGGYKGLSQAYRASGYEPPTKKQYLGRLGGAAAGGFVLPVPVLGPAIGEYLVQRHLQTAPKKLKISSCRDELSKISYKVTYMTPQEIRQRTGIPGAMGGYNPQTKEVWLPKLKGIGLPDWLASGLEQDIHAHELTHARRGAKGAFKNLEKPGLGILKLPREEAIAYPAGLSAIKNMRARLLQYPSVGLNFMGSSRWKQRHQLYLPTMLGRGKALQALRGAVGIGLAGAAIRGRNRHKELGRGK
jgi:hypothetical protein